MVGDETNRLKAFLNEATPYAAETDEEVQNRLVAGASEWATEGTSQDRREPTTPDSGKTGWAVSTNFEQQPVPRGEDLYSDSTLEPDITDDSKPALDDQANDSFEEFEPGEVKPLSRETLTPQIARVLLERDELEGQLVVESSDRSVKAVADVAGRITSLTLSVGSRRDMNISQLSKAVCEAVNSARNRSARLAIELAVRDHLERS